MTGGAGTTTVAGDPDIDATQPATQRLQQGWSGPGTGSDGAWRWPAPAGTGAVGIPGIGADPWRA